MPDNDKIIEIDNKVALLAASMAVKVQEAYDNPGPPPVISGTSSDTETLAVGSKSFTTQAGIAWSTAQRLRIASDDGTKVLEGSVISYVGTTLDILIDFVQGTGSHNDWNISIGGTSATTPVIIGTSSTSLTIGLGAKNFTTQAGIAWTLGQRIRAASNDGTKVMVGEITAYTGTSLILNVDYYESTGTHNAWNLSVAGEIGDSAYQLAVNNGFVGTETQWLESLKSPYSSPMQNHVDWTAGGNFRTFGVGSGASGSLSGNTAAAFEKLLNTIEVAYTTLDFTKVRPAPTYTSDHLRNCVKRVIEVLHGMYVSEFTNDYDPGMHDYVMHGHVHAFDGIEDYNYAPVGAFLVSYGSKNLTTSTSTIHFYDNCYIDIFNLRPRTQANSEKQGINRIVAHFSYFVEFDGGGTVIGAGVTTFKSAIW